jgi:hypothetical protein
MMRCLSTVTFWIRQNVTFHVTVQPGITE